MLEIGKPKNLEEGPPIVETQTAEEGTAWLVLTSLSSEERLVEPDTDP